MALTPEQLKKLESLRHYSTRYELILQTPSGKKYLVVYTPKRNYKGILDAIHENGSEKGKKILKILNLPENTTIKKDEKYKGFIFPDGSRMYFSGRTQKDAILSGELPFILKVPT
ncbi:MAG: hypothetical protein NC934_07030 [Candidatus Omnitrophica bacterium]|nr:hypothetical protein [Candidatus Omnitrophota bacterium]